jgi:hypothetical protein
VPIPNGTKLAEVPAMLAANVARYNATVGATYNPPYTDYVATRNAGIAAAGSLSAWLAGGAAPIQMLLDAFGMNAQKSRLVPLARFQGILSGLPSAGVNWVAGLTLPLEVPPPRLVNAATGHTLSAELHLLYDSFARPNSVTDSGGYVAASKTMHCLFPELAPIIDG